MVWKDYHCIPFHSQNTTITIASFFWDKICQRFSPTFISLFTNNIQLHKKGIPRSPFPECVASNSIERRLLDYLRYTKADRHRESQKRTANTTLFCTIYQVALVGNCVSTDSSRLAIHCGRYNIQLLVLKNVYFPEANLFMFQMFLPYKASSIPFNEAKETSLKSLTLIIIHHCGAKYKKCSPHKTIPRWETYIFQTAKN